MLNILNEKTSALGEAYKLNQQHDAPSNCRDLAVQNSSGVIATCPDAEPIPGIPAMFLDLTPTAPSLKASMPTNACRTTLVP